MKLAQMSVKRPVFMTVILLVFALMGMYSYNLIPLDLIPRVSIPVVTVFTIYPGAGPLEVENLVSKQIEDAISSVNGIKRLKSESMDNISSVIIEFNDDVDVDVAATDVRDKVSSIMNKLPDDIEQPQILKLDLNSKAVITLGLLSDNLSTGELTEYTDRVLKDRISNITGVAQVDFIGARYREIQILISEDTLKKYGISLSWLAYTLSSVSIDVPGGHITQNKFEYSIKFSGEADNVDDFLNMDLQLPGGSIIKLKEIADVKDTFEEERQRSRFNGKNSIFLVIKKRSDANAVSTVENVRKELIKIKKELPVGTSIIEASNDADFVKDSLNDLYSNMGIGILLTAVVLYLFLMNWQGTIIACLSIPFSIVATFTFIYFFGFTLNMMSLMALAICVGILVNNAIIVLENIITRHERGENIETASIEGTSEIFIAVTGATMTNVLVFTPIAFMSGVIGQFFKQFGLTAVFATLLSLLVSFTMTPMMAAWLIKNKKEKQNNGIIFKSLKKFERAYLSLRDDYLKILEFSLKKPAMILVIAVALFFGSFFFGKYIGFEFVTNPDKGTFNITVRTPPGSSLNETDNAMKEIEEIVKKIPELDLYYTKVGKTESMIGGSSEGTNIGEITVKVVDKSKRSRSQNEIAESLMPELSKIPSATIGIIFFGIMGAEESPLQIQVMGPNMKKLEELSLKVMDIVTNINGTKDIDTTYISGKPEIKIIPDRLKIRESGLTEQMLGIEIRGRYEGLIPVKLKDGSEEYDVRIKLMENERKDVQQLANSDIILSGGISYPLKDLATLEETQLPAKISRKERQRMISINGRTEGRSYGEVLNDIKDEIAKQEIPDGYKIVYAGMAERMDDMIMLVEAFFMAVILTFLLLAALLESWVHPFTIMFTLPLAIIGVLFSLFITDSTISIFSLMAVVMLVGIVVNNGILLIEYATEAEKRGKTVKVSIIEACRERFRAIIMTAIAATLAMVPLALGNGAGGEMRSSMAIVSIGGLMVSTLMSFFVIPAMYIIVENMRNRFWYKKS